MKLHLKTASKFKRYYKKLHGSLPIDKALVQYFLDSIQQYLKEDGVRSKLLNNGGKLPKDWRPEYVHAADTLRFIGDWTDRAYAIRAVTKDISCFAHNIAWDQRTKLGINKRASWRFRVWQIGRSESTSGFRIFSGIRNAKVASTAAC